MFLNERVYRNSGKSFEKQEKLTEINSKLNSEIIKHDIYFTACVCLFEPTLKKNKYK